jgi:hypothetical protein
VVPVQSLDELTHVTDCNIPVHTVSFADFLRDARLVVSTLEEFENLRADEVHRKHLPVVNVEENRAVLRLRTAYVTRDSEHKCLGEFALPCSAAECRSKARCNPLRSISVRKEATRPLSGFMAMR